LTTNYSDLHAVDRAVMHEFNVVVYNPTLALEVELETEIVTVRALSTVPVMKLAPVGVVNDDVRAQPVEEVSNRWANEIARDLAVPGAVESKIFVPYV
jgi:hypothetical protein